MVEEEGAGDVSRADGRDEAVRGTRSLRGTFSAVATRFDNVRLEYVYLVIALVFGLALIVLLPPFQSPDEPSHFYRAWGIAEGRIFPPRDFIEQLPTNVWSLQTAFPTGVIGSPDHYQGYSPDTVYRLLGEPISQRTVKVHTAIPSQNPIGYLPQAFAVAIARVTGWSPLGAFYLARLFNLLVAVAMVFIAIRIAPFGKAMFLIPALFPVTVAEMASTSPDALMIAGAMLFTALCLFYSERVRLTWREMVLLLVVAAGLLSIKPGYFTLAALVFVIPARSLGSRRRWAAWIVGILGVVLVIAALMVLAPPVAPIDVAREIGPVVDGADSTAQLRFVMAHPLTFVDTLVNSFGTQGLELGYWMIGMLSWFTVRVSQVATLAFLVLTLCLIGGVDGEPAVGVRRRAVLLSTSAISTAVMCLAIYLALTPVGLPTVYGLQGRYFTPILPLLLLGLYRIRLRRQSLVILLIALTLAAVILTTLRAVWFHYF